MNIFKKCTYHTVSDKSSITELNNKCKKKTINKSELSIKFF